MNAYSAQERRRHPRHNLAVEVVLFGRHHSFRTQSLNISLSGILLAEAIPGPMVGDPIDIVLIHTHKGKRLRILLTGMMVGAPFRTARISFLNMPLIQHMKLQDLLGSLSVA